MFGMPIVFAAIQVALLLFVFPYPTPLEMKQAGNMDKLQELMGKMYPQMDIHERIEQIVIQEGQKGQVSLKQTFCDPVIRQAAWVGCSLSVFQQLTGINMIIFYSSSIFSSGNLSPNQATAILLGCNCLFSATSAGFLTLYGRKTLLLSMTAAGTVFLMITGIAADKQLTTFELVMCIAFLFAY